MSVHQPRPAPPTAGGSGVMPPNPGSGGVPPETRTRQSLESELAAVIEGYNNAITRAAAAETLARATPELLAAAKRVAAFEPFAKWRDNGPLFALRRAIDRAEGRGA